MWNLIGDEVSRTLTAPADVIYAVISDVTRMPELSPEIVLRMGHGRWPDGGRPVPCKEQDAPGAIVVEHP